MLKCDFHIHTKEDIKDVWIKYNAKQIISYGAKLGFEVMSITNHQNVFFNNDIKYYAKKKGVLLIPGTESLVDGKELIILNMPKKYWKKEEFLFNQIEKMRANNILTIAPHPFYPLKTCMGKLIYKHKNLIDALEYSHFYSWWFNRYNKKTVIAAKKLNLPLIGTSDVHKIYQFNNTYTMLDCDKNLDSVFEAIRKNKIKLISKPLSSQKFIKTGFEAIFGTKIINNKLN